MKIKEIKNLILASSSPRRAQIMKDCGLAPVVLPSDYDEILPIALSPAEQSMFFALGKAMNVAEKIEQDPGAFSDTADGVRSDSSAVNSKDKGEIMLEPSYPVIVGSDTIVCLGNTVFEKPKDKEDGFNMLSSLRGRTHHVISGVCIAIPKARIYKVFYETTAVTFGDFSDDELNAYLEMDEAYDKSGGYAVQGTFKKYVKKIEGDINNVIGFPLERFIKEFEAI